MEMSLSAGDPVLCVACRCLVMCPSTSLCTQRTSGVDAALGPSYRGHETEKRKISARSGSNSLRHILSKRSLRASMGFSVGGSRPPGRLNIS